MPINTLSRASSLHYSCRNVSLHSRKRMDLVTIMRGRSSAGSARRHGRRNRRYFFLRPRKPVGLGGGWGTGRKGRGREGENNLKAELNFSSSESFVRALGGGQWLNGDVSRKVDSRERPALYRPSLQPHLALFTPTRTRERERAVLYRREKIYTREREREREREKTTSLGGVAQHPQMLRATMRRLRAGFVTAIHTRTHTHAYLHTPVPIIDSGSVHLYIERVPSQTVA